MSDPAPALGGASFQGFARVEETAPRGMLTLRGDQASDDFAGAVRQAAGVDVPDKLGIVTEADVALAWMSPDELLVLCRYSQASALVKSLGEALAGQHHLVADVSDARAMFSVNGEDAREAMAKLTPADVSPAAFRPGMFRRSRLAQVPAAFWMPDEAGFNVICFRSAARYVFDLLSTAVQSGSEVEYFQR